MKSLALECYETEAMSFQDLLEIDGGHQGTAYAVGHAIGEGISGVKVLAETVIAVAGAIAFFSL